MSDETNPWKLLSAETVYENAWIRVEDHAVVKPSGDKGQYGKVCFKSRAVAVVALDSSNRICLVGQYRYTLGEYSWELPMGGAALDENVLDAAQRELREETGLHASHWRQLMRIHPSNSVTDEVGFVFSARNLKQGPASPEDTEQLEIKTLPLDEAVQWVLDGRITDAISIAGILYIAAHGIESTDSSR